MALLEILNYRFLTQLNFLPTRRDGVLDLLITNVLDLVRVREMPSPKKTRCVHRPWLGVFRLLRLHKTHP